MVNNKRLVKWFNCKALAIKKIKRQGFCNEMDLASVLEDTTGQYYSRLRESLPILFEENGQIHNLRLSEMDDSFFSSLKKVILEDDIYLLHLLVYCMDRAIIQCYNTLETFEEEYEEIEGLNDNWKETGICILKRVTCAWQVRNIGSCEESLFYNFYYIEKQEDIKVSNYVLQRSSVLKSGKPNLRVAISPLTKEEVVVFSEPYEYSNIHTKQKQHYFRVETIKNTDWLEQEIIRNMEYSGTHDVDILVFPEMLGSQEMLNNVLDFFQQNRDKKVPPLVVFPSIWEKTEDDRNNTNVSCLLLDGRQIMFRQNKRICFYYKDKDGTKVFEDINRDPDAPDILNVLHIDGIGRICIIICYDYLHNENREMIKKLIKPTLICCPSFSTGSFNFQILQESGYYAGCNCIWCNTCSAANAAGSDKNFEIVGGIGNLSKKCDQMDAETFKKVFEGRKNCKKEICSQCVYYSDIPLKK